MIHRYQYKDIVWIDLESPTEAEVKALIDQFHLNQLVGKELHTPTPKPKVELYKDFVYLILHFPAFKHSHSKGVQQEIDFILGKKFLITTHYDMIDPLHEFSKVFEVNSILDKSDIGDHAGYIFYYMISNLYKALSHELDAITANLKVIEEGIFKGKEREMVISLSNVSRTLLDFKQSMELHHEVLKPFETAAKKFYGEEFGYSLSVIMSEHFKVHNTVRSKIELMKELRETNNALLSTKQNEVMKVLTVIAFIALPLTLVISLFQVDAISRPIVGEPNDFWTLVVMLGSIGTMMFAFSKYKKWL
jgi:magnesium transporter